MAGCPSGPSSAFVIVMAADLQNSTHEKHAIHPSEFSTPTSPPSRPTSTGACAPGPLWGQRLTQSPHATHRSLIILISGTLPTCLLVRAAGHAGDERPDRQLQPGSRGIADVYAPHGVLRDAG